jgi:hypothetical protein
MKGMRLLIAAELIEKKGRIGVWKVKSSPRPWYRVYIRVHTKNEGEAWFLKEEHGGYVYQADKWNKPNQWIWSIQSKKVEGVLEKLLPYLTTFRSRAEIALQLRATIGLEKRDTLRIPDKIWDKRVSLSEELRR